MRSRLSPKAGVAVRRLRLARGLTLAELSERSGIPLSTLSKLELNQLSLTYDKLLRLARALGVEAQDFIGEAAEGAAPRGRRALQRRGSGEVRRWGPHRTLVTAAELLSKAFSPIVFEAKASTLKAHGPLLQLNGEAYLLCLEGEICLHMESYAPLWLQHGDGVYFDGRSPHAILGNGKETSRALLVTSPDDPSFS